MTDEDVRRNLFDRMNKELSSNKLSDGQTSDSSGKTGPGKFFIMINLLAISIDTVTTSRLLVWSVAKEFFIPSLTVS